MLVFARDWARAIEVFLRYFAVHVRLRTGHPIARLRVLPFDVVDVLGLGVLEWGWAGLEDGGPGPINCGLFYWAALLRGGVS